MKKTIFATAIFAAAAGIFSNVFRSDSEAVQSNESQSNDHGAALVDIVMPAKLSMNAQIGQRGFEANCAVCHGTNGIGQQGVAPPLVHIIYEPGHHGDESFQRAVAQGVRSHHWSFGNMPPVDGLTRGDVKMITQYVREVQRANGIY